MPEARRLNSQRNIGLNACAAPAAVAVKTAGHIRAQNKRAACVYPLDHLFVNAVRLPVKTRTEQTIHDRIALIVAIFHRKNLSAAALVFLCKNFRIALGAVCCKHFYPAALFP